MEYEITQASKETGSIIVRYIDGEKVLGDYTIDIPIENGEFITGLTLENEIQSRAPIWLLERKQAVSTATNFSTIEALVTPDLITAPVVSMPEVFNVEAMPQ